MRGRIASDEPCDLGERRLEVSRVAVAIAIDEEPRRPVCFRGYILTEHARDLICIPRQRSDRRMSTRTIVVRAEKHGISQHHWHPQKPAYSTDIALLPASRTDI